MTSATADVIISQASRVSASESRPKVGIAQATLGTRNWNLGAAKVYYPSRLRCSSMTSHYSGFKENVLGIWQPDNLCWTCVLACNKLRCHYKICSLTRVGFVSTDEQKEKSLKKSSFPRPHAYLLVRYGLCTANKKKCIKSGIHVIDASTGRRSDHDVTFYNTF